MNGILYIVATPIGNLEDITLRTLTTLKSVDLIACEDTRHSQTLLSKYEIHKPLVSYHQHSKLQKIDWLVEQLRAGKSVAVISDAGTPGISDPGLVLVAEVLKVGIKVVPIPGVSALTTLLSVAGLPADRFTFRGFLPHKKGRATMLEQIVSSNLPSIFFESTHRILKTLEFFADQTGYLVIGRELTKKFEEIVRGDGKSVLEHFRTSSFAGEFVVLYSPKDNPIKDT